MSPQKISELLQVPPFITGALLLLGCSISIDCFALENDSYSNLPSNSNINTSDDPNASSVYKINLVVIPGGEFYIGEPETSYQGPPNSYDAPEFIVTVSAFQMSDTEVTNYQYVQFLNAADNDGFVTVFTETSHGPDKGNVLVKGAENAPEIYKGEILVNLSGTRVMKDHDNSDGDNDEFTGVIEPENPLNISYIGFDDNLEIGERFFVKDPKNENDFDWKLLTDYYNYTSISRQLDTSETLNDYDNWPELADYPDNLPTLENVNNYPATFIRWHGAKAFAVYYGYDLPTEAEWEYASKAGQSFEYATDDGFVDNDGTSAIWNHLGDNPSKGHVADVKTNEANPFGLYNLAGNVWEWIEDWYDADFYSESTNPVNTSNSGFKVRRGGSWNYHLSTLKTAARAKDEQYKGNDHFGFRVVKRASEGSIDSDGDLVADEFDAFPTDPAASVDTDGDGFPDQWNEGYDISDSTTGLSLDEFPSDPSEHSDNDGDGTGDNADLDDDNDGMPDEFEVLYGLNPFDSADANEDLDGDGSTNLEEFLSNTDPTDPNSFPHSENKKTAFDYDLDGKADIAVRRASNFYQYILNTKDNQIQRVQFGRHESDIPVSGDFDGDGLADVAVRRPSNQYWYILNSSDGEIQRINFGKQVEDIPVPADYDGDGITDIAVRRPSNQMWYIKNSTDGIIQRINFGLNADDIPVPADYDGDGKADVAVRRPSNQYWYILNSSNGVIQRINFGKDQNDIPVPGDYDGDGRADVAVRRPSNQYWYILNSSNGQIQRIHFGKQETDIPIPADYDGDGKFDVAVRRPSTHYQYILNSSDGQIQRIQFGKNVEDIPLAAPITTRMNWATGNTELFP